MRELILQVKAEAEEAIRDSEANDTYHKNALLESSNLRDRLRYRVSQCDEALEAITEAAKHLAGADR